MSDDTNIEWTDATWNPVRGCSKVSPGCANCYAMHVAARFCGPGEAYDFLAKRNPVNWTGAIRFVPEVLSRPLRWLRPRLIFVNSMSDLFHERLPVEQIAAIFGVMALAGQHTFQVLTKRAQRMQEIVSQLSLDRVLDAALAVSLRDGTPALRLGNPRQRSQVASLMREIGRNPEVFNTSWPLDNVHLGVSIEHQERDGRLQWLLKTPAALRFVSAEPLLGTLDLGLRNWANVDRDDCRLDWVIVGGESGRGARPCDIGNIRAIVQDCRLAGVPCFVKQLGAKPYDTRLADALPVTKRYFLESEEEEIAMAQELGEYLEAIHWLPINHPKGGDPAEWPEDLRVRQMPREAAAAFTPAGY